MIGVGQQLGGYTILHRIGQGGMGDVYLAQHRRVARKAAVKVLLPELSQKATVLDRFFNEARATSLIKHPGIVEILDCDVLDDQAFIIMEYLEGESLGEYLHRAGALGADLPFLLGVSTSIASAVGAAHNTGIIHRDLKPDNVYLHLPSVSDPTVTVKILDFGIAKLAQQEGGTSQTKTGMLLGTPAYMSPEQCRGAGLVDLRSDIYSLGCILYELICGAPPFVHEGAGDMIIAHVSEAPEAPAARVPGIAPALNALIMRMLGKKPEQRPQSMDEVANELAACARSVGVAIDKPLRPRVPVERPPEAVQFSSTQVSPTGIPRSQVTPLPGSGAIRASSSPSLRPQTPYPAPSKPASVIESGRVRVPSGPNPVLEPSGPIAVGGTRVMETVRPTTTMGSAAAEIAPNPVAAAPPKRGMTFAIAGGTIVAVGGILAVVFTRGGSPAKTVSVAEPAVVAAAPAPEKLPPAPPAAEPPPAPAADPKPVAEAAVPPTVRIDLQGVPARTVVTVDGRAADLPLQLPRGSQMHHVVLKPPSGAERVLDLDGSKDRLVELLFDKPHGSSDGQGSHGGSGESSGHHSSGSSHGSGKKKPAGDRDAITDI
ncbi:MAG TPA: serine/threonine-protein kinase [Polyangia bacterium]|jgi:serine/threonine-protein kinase|nr:serine/threonine-protein kinase [Polyangia bacterium]